MDGHLPEIVDVGLRRDGDEHPGRLHLERFPHHVAPANVVARRDADTRARTRTALDKALVFESKEGQRDRQKTHTEFSGHLAAGDRFAQAELTAQNPVPDVAMRLIHQAGSRSRRLHGWHSVSATKGRIRLVTQRHRHDGTEYSK